MQVLPDRSSQSPTDALALIEDNQLNRRNTLLLAEWGELIDTARFNKLIGSSQLLGEDLNFIIGNAFGWDSKSRQNSQLRFVSLSPLVFTHELAAVMLLEQCFRYLDKLRGGNFTK